MTPTKTQLKRIIDDLDSIQVFVQIHITQTGVMIYAKSECDRLIAKKELIRCGFVVNEKITDAVEKTKCPTCTGKGKLWCAMCGTWGNHRSGGCPEFKREWEKTAEL
jgi:uncharacterized UBP type Zn finger protein